MSVKKNCASPTKSLTARHCNQLVIWMLESWYVRQYFNEVYPCIYNLLLFSH